MQDIFVFAKQHSALMLAIVVVLILLILLEFIRQTKSARQISAHRATHLMNHQDGTMVDIRPNDIFIKGHIVGALSLPLSDLIKSSKKLEKYKSNPVIIVCASGLESAKAANTLKNQGFHVFILQGGMRQWKEAGMPIIKD